MIQKLIDAISVTLNSEFGDEYEIYQESIEQGLKRPCFSIVCVLPTNERYFANRYRRTNKFCIHYFPPKGNEKADCYEKLERLWQLFEFIDFDGSKIKGSEMNGEFEDGILHFFVNFDFYVDKVLEKPKMETVEQSSKVKG